MIAAAVKRTGRVGQLIIASVLAGVLIAGLALPLVGGIGLAAKGSADSFENLPSELVVPPLAQGSRVLAADGTLLATYFAEDRLIVSLRQVPAVMRTAIVAIEDSRFYEHHGIDTRGILRAAVTNAQAGGVQQGASTLTQQYVKNVLLSSARTKAQKDAAAGKSVGRKLREARYALSLEQQWSKDRILEGYLNIAYFGSGAYGVGAAARHYFSKPVGKLTLPEAALLAGIVRSPIALDPTLHPLAAKSRRDTVLQRMADLGKITQLQASRAMASKVALHVSSRRNGCTGSLAGFFCDYVVKTAFLDNPAFGKTRDDRVELLYRGGLTIRTSLDRRLQQAADNGIRKHVKVSDQVGAATSIVEPGTGLIKAMAVNRVFGGKQPGHTEVNFATGGTQGVEGGSTFKIFTLAAALEAGIPLSTTLACPPSYTSRIDPRYSPHNAETGEGGLFDLETATWKSVNTCFVQLEERIPGETERPASMAEAMGVRVVAGNRPLNRGPSFTLGGDSISPLAMSGVYAAFAAHGMFCPPTAIVSVADGKGRPMRLPPPACKQVVSRAVADTVTSVLRGVITNGTGTAAHIGRPAAGKTGTATDYGAAWFDGYTPQLAAAVWMGDPRGSAKHKLRGVRIGGHFYGRVFGGTISAPIWRDVMKAALEGQPVERFSGPDSALLHGRFVTVPDVSGMSVGRARSRLAARGLTGIVAPGLVSAGGSAGTVGRTNPRAGNTIGFGSSVLIFVTDGTLPAPPRTQPPRTQPPTPPATQPSTSPPSLPPPTPTPRPKPTKTKKPRSPSASAPPGG